MRSIPGFGVNTALNQYRAHLGHTVLVSANGKHSSKIALSLKRSMRLTSRKHR